MIIYLRNSLSLVLILTALFAGCQSLGESTEGDSKPVTNTSQRNTSTWKIDSSSLVGLSDEYGNASVQYMQTAMQLLAGKGVMPTRDYYEYAPPSAKTATLDLQSDEFPVVATIQGRYSVPVEIMLVPPPKVVKDQLPPPRNLQNLAKEGSGNPPWNPDLIGTSFFVPKEDCGDWGTTLATPRGYPSFRWGCHTTIGWQEHLCRLVSFFDYADFVQFPQNERFPDEATWIGAITCVAVAEDNPVLRWVYLNELNGSIEHWLAYAIVDANGAYSGEIPYGPNGYTTDSFLRPLNAPFAPKLQVNRGLEDLVKNAPREHNLLRVPLPRSLQEVELGPEKSEDWTLCEEYYSEHKIPAWLLLADKDSKPWREQFYLRHALDDSKHIPWKLIVFSNIEPADLIDALGKLKGVAPADMPSSEAIRKQLFPKYQAMLDAADSR